MLEPGLPNEKMKRNEIFNMCLYCPCFQGDGHAPRGGPFRPVHAGDLAAALVGRDDHHRHDGPLHERQPRPVRHRPRAGGVRHQLLGLPQVCTFPLKRFTYIF